MANPKPRYDPTPEQITRAAAKIREGWDEETYLSRGIHLETTSHKNSRVSDVATVRKMCQWNIPVVSLPGIVESQ